jgi:hypothetical protein
VATTEVTNLEIAGLVKTNMRFGEEERSGPRGKSFFEEALDDNLCFRRGNGSIATKQDFLDGLEDPDNTSELLTTEILQVQMLGEQAFVEARVQFKGRRGGDDVEGVFRNLRLFEKQDSWRCVMWFNKKIGRLNPGTD